MDDVLLPTRVQLSFDELFNAGDEEDERHANLRRTSEDLYGGVPAVPILANRRSRRVLQPAPDGIEQPSLFDLSEPSETGVGDHRSSSADDDGRDSRGTDLSHSNDGRELGRGLGRDRSGVLERGRPGGVDGTAPGSGEHLLTPRQRIEANLNALRTVKAIRVTNRDASADEQAILSQWTGWGAVPAIFDPDDHTYSAQRDELTQLLGESEFNAARRSVLNAHYTPPSVVDALWYAIEAFGFRAGRVLEPGCGSGNFIRYAPAEANVVGVELDPISAAIAQYLFPTAFVRNENFAETAYPSDSFDVAIGNVPFGQITLHDKRHNPHRHSIHNHFILKSLDLVRPGGLCALITSHYTLDALDVSARRDMADKATLIAALRLPHTAFGSAGTKVITDILFFQRHADRKILGPSFVHTQSVDITGTHIPLNEYFVTHPDHVLGTMSVAFGRYSRPELVVEPDSAKTLNASIEQIIASAPEVKPRFLALTNTTSTEVHAKHDSVREIDVASLKEGSIVALTATSFGICHNGQIEPFGPVPKTQQKELVSLCRLRDALRDVLNAQATFADDTELHRVQQILEQRYDAYVRSFGVIGRYRRSISTDEDGNEVERRTFPRMGGFRVDPDFPSLLALETVDPDHMTATKADIFTQRVVHQRTVPTSVATVEEAMAISLSEKGHIDSVLIGQLLGTNPSDTEALLAPHVFLDPSTDTLVPASMYLSGNVREKLSQAVKAQAGGTDFERNIRALEAVIPTDLLPSEIDARLGATWIDAEYVAEFVQDLLHSGEINVEYLPATGDWTIKAYPWDRSSVLATSTWGTSRADAIALISNSLNQAKIVIRDTDLNGKQIVNAQATLEALDKQAQIEERFSAWVWEDPLRAELLAHKYNNLFNATVPTQYDGSHLTLPGLASSFVPHKHQRDAIWRIISEPTVLLGHAVGAGKTATMIIGGMELKRLGVINKPAFVVPNHMLEQFAGEFLQLYPLASILVASKDGAAKDRKEFVARCAAGEWDAIIITHATFGRIPVSPSSERGWIAEQVEAFREAADTSSYRTTIKKLEAAVMRLEERSRRLLDDERTFDGVSFEETGIDYLFLDEAHLFKNLAFPTHITGVGAKPSRRAAQLELKLHIMRQQYGERVATLATATPVVNSIAELYVMQRFLQPEVLHYCGIASFDSWAANFGRTITAIELAPDGGSYRMQTRFARFANVPDLLALVGRVADIKTSGDLGLAVPALSGGKAHVVVAQASSELERYVEQLVERSECVASRGVAPTEDNMLKITSDGRKAALDLRLVGHEKPLTPTKLDLAVHNIYQIYTAHHLDRFANSSRPGALQIVFSDIGVANGAGWSVYTELKTQLVQLGINESAIRFAQEAKTDTAKAELFRAARDGEIAVLIGSTSSMGIGTNVQARAVALHHLDCPWTPADITQREGRILRQGNLNAEVGIYRYVTEKSFDIFMWGTVERKQHFLDQLAEAHGALARTLDDVSSSALSYAEVKAIATGNPLIMEKAGIEAELVKLERLEAAHNRGQHSLHTAVRTLPITIGRLETEISGLEVGIERRVDLSADAFVAVIDGHTITTRKETGAALLAKLQTMRHRQAEQLPLATIAGLDLYVNTQKDADRFHLGFADVASSVVVFDQSELGKVDPTGLVSRILRAVKDFDEMRNTRLVELVRARQNLAEAEAQVDKAFDQHERITQLRQRLAVIDAELMPERVADDAGLQDGHSNDEDGRFSDKSRRMTLERVLPERCVGDHVPTLRPASQSTPAISAPML